MKATTSTLIGVLPYHRCCHSHTHTLFLSQQAVLTALAEHEHMLHMLANADGQQDDGSHHVATDGHLATTPVVHS